MESNLKSFKKVNNIAGWGTFAIASFVYLLTIEPTVSFWDCGEFILSAWKMQVGHPPGAPFFLILARVFSLFSMGDQSKAAMMINIMSALASGFTIMFLYWTITHLVRKVVAARSSFSDGMIWPVVAAGIIGSLAYTFSDTFWFSAVEGEVYATSSLFTAIVFWAILKWEDEPEPKLSGRWIVLIAYLMGLSIGVHLLNLLVIPAIVLVFYFRRNTPSISGILKTLLFSFVILGILVFLLIPYTVKIAGWFELLFVNGIGLPVNTGLFFYLILLISSIILGLIYSIKKGKRILNWVLTLFAVLFLGYSSYATIMIRANASPPMNQNSPSDVFSMIYYVNREQYGSTPLIKGAYYSAPVVDVKKRNAGYMREGDRYVKYERNKYEYDKSFITLFPRMYSSEENHIPEYEYWGNIKGTKVAYNTSGGRREFVLPTFGENLRFFFRYQVGYMYLRYFMWNFAGRQNDIQGNGNVMHGNWISGIDGFDSSRLGDQDSLPEELKNNPGRNRYYFLPLIFGLMGIAWQYRSDRHGFWVVLLLFIMTGLAIVVYLNQYPLQPRERDYAYAGSFYAFTIWIGMGFYLLYELLAKIVTKRVALVAGFVLSFFSVPLLLASENWDDHDRSGRYTARDIGSNYLNSCDENAILFTYGDNDSFPVWYAQDVEGIRTDVRVANLSYISAGWYIDMMRQKAYLSEPMPFTLTSEKYKTGEREQLPIVPKMDRPYDIMELVKFAGLDDRQAKIDITGRGDYFNYLPTQKFIIPVDSARVLTNGTVKEYQKDRLLKEVIWNYNDRELYKNDLAVMDLIATSAWSRPIYYATTVPPASYRGLDEYFQMEGLAYRLVPLDSTGTRSSDVGFMDTRKMYDNVMNRFKWGNASDPAVYLDENNRRMFSNFRRLFGMLATGLALEGDTLRALEVINRSIEVIPPEKIEHDYYSLGIVEALFMCGRQQEAMETAEAVIKLSKEYLDYIIQLDYLRRYDLEYVTGINMQALIRLYNMAISTGNKELEQLVGNNLDKYYAELYGR